MRLWMTVGALSLAACGSPKSSDSAAPGADPDEARAAELWDTLEGADTWSQVDAWLGVQPSDTLHDAYTQVWWNDTAFDHVSAGGGGDMPAGSIVYKKSYSDADGATETGSTVMEKTAEGWFWASYEPDGTVRLAGEPSLCIDCHAAGQDSILTTTW